MNHIAAEVFVSRIYKDFILKRKKVIKETFHLEKGQKS